MTRFGILDTESNDEDFAAKLYEEIVFFPWFKPEVCNSLRACLSVISARLDILASNVIDVVTGQLRF